MRSSIVAAAALLWASCGLAAPTAKAAEAMTELEARVSKFTYYEMPTPLAGPCDVTTGPDGRLWIQYFLVNKLTALDVTTGDIEEFEIPYQFEALNITLLGEEPGRSGITACAIQPGNDGNIYAASGVRNEFVKVDLATKEVSVFDPSMPLGGLQPLNDLWRGTEGMFFSMTTASQIVLFNYNTHGFTYYSPPTPDSSPLGMRVASDGALWFAEFLGDKIGRLDQTTGEITEYAVPTALQGPGVMRAEMIQDGVNYLWFCGFTGNTLGRIEVATGAITLYPLEALALPVEDDTDSFGRVWFSTATSNTVKYLNPFNNFEITHIQEPGILLPTPTELVPAANIAIHYGPLNRMWFTDLSLNRVGSYQLERCGDNYNPCTAGDA